MNGCSAGFWLLGEKCSDLKQKPYERCVQRLLAMTLLCACLDAYQLWGLRAKNSEFGTTVFVFLMILHGQVSLSA